jgi:hypothetical protein
MQINTNRKIGIYASSGYGKSYLANKIASIIKIPIYIYDTDREAINEIYFNYDNVKIYIPPIAESENIKTLNKWLKEKLTLSNIFIYIEDLDLFFDENSQLGKGASEIKYLSSKGRHQRIGFMYSAKQLSHIPTKLRANTNLFFFGYFSNDTEIDKIKKIIGKRAYNEIYSKINPQEHEFLMYDTLSKELKIIKIGE